MRASDRRKTSEPSEVIEFVPRKELDQAERKIERLQKENERLKQETDRLRRELEAALRASKRHRIPAANQSPTPSGQGASWAGTTVSKRAVPFRRASMNRSQSPCPSAAHIAAAVTCSRRVVRRSIRKTSSGRPWYAALILRWGVAEGVRGRCRGGIRWRPPMLWGGVS